MKSKSARFLFLPALPAMKSKSALLPARPKKSNSRFASVGEFASTTCS